MRKLICVNYYINQVIKKVYNRYKHIYDVYIMLFDSDLLKFTKSDIFTEDKQSELMASFLHKGGNILEPSVGTGNLLKYISVENYDSIDVFEVKQEFLDQIKGKKIKKFNKDFLKTNITTKYNNIILNPPYIRTQDLSESYRKFIKTEFSILKNGLVDIYYAFLIKCLDLLEINGIMVSITPNTFLYNKSAVLIRKYLIENRYIQKIIDYGSEKVFPNVSVYCCITVFTKQPNDFFLYNNTKREYVDIDDTTFNLFALNVGDNTLKNICKITNGVATLRDNVYIMESDKFGEPCIVSITTGKEDSYIIYPYNEYGKIIDEEEFKKENPKTYNYLITYKSELSKRDKGNKKYASWYAYGRSQSLIVSKKKNVIYMPCFINPNKFELYVKPPTLFKGCLCIEPNDEKDIELICGLIRKHINILEMNSSKRGSGWINISSRNLYNLPLSS